MKRILLLALAAALLAACAAPTPSPTSTPNLTRLAQQVRSTAHAEANQKTRQALPPTLTRLPTLTPNPTYTPYPSPTPAFTRTAQATAAPQSSPTSAAAAFAQFAKNAKILVYEDNYQPQGEGYWIRDALDAAGYRYQHSGEKIGDFYAALQSDTDWDLILIGEETKTLIDGEVLAAVLARMDRGTPVAFETWKTYTYYSHGMAELLKRCGVEYQRKWTRLEPLAVVNKALPLAKTPNALPAVFEVGADQGYFKNNGDYLKLAPGSKAQFLLGRYPTRAEDYGSAVLCQDQRLILQSFVQQNYPKPSMLLLWQNYIDFLLRQRLAQKP
ncbi:MAG TPA: hypothetical protein VIO61_06090 [Anaerolineaceae bacterium]